MGKKTRIHGPINNTLRAEINKKRKDYSGSFSDFLYTLMLRINYPKSYQSDYKLKIENEDKIESTIDFELDKDAADFWKNIKTLFPSIEFTLDYIISQQKIQYPGEKKDMIIYDVNKFED